MPATDAKYRKQWGKIRIVCECGQHITKGSKYNHLKSNKHIQAMQKINDMTVPARVEARILKIFPLLSQSKLKRIVTIILE